MTRTLQIDSAFGHRIGREHIAGPCREAEIIDNSDGLYTHSNSEEHDLEKTNLEMLKPIGNLQKH